MVLAGFMPHDRPPQPFRSAHGLLLTNGGLERSSQKAPGMSSSFYNEKGKLEG
jgi:hypothetical protein